MYEILFLLQKGKKLIFDQSQLNVKHKKQIYKSKYDNEEFISKTMNENCQEV